jgi:hypothetical protein
MKKFFTIAAIGFIIYFTTTQYVKNQDIKSTQKEQKLIEENISNANSNNGFIESTLTKVFSNVLKTKEGQEVFAKLVHPVNSIGENIIFKMNNSEIIHNIFKINITGLENDKKAICGSIVDVEYKIQDLNTGFVETKRQNIQLGSESIDIALSNIIVGMSEGQTRTGVTIEEFLPNKKVQDKNIPKNIEVTLHKVVSGKSIDSSKIKIFDDVLSSHTPYLCGEKINFKLKISKFDGSLVATPKENISYIIGDNSFPVIFAYGLFNKMRTGTRTIISPGSYLKSVNSKMFKDSKINNNEYYILDIDEVP